MLSIRGRPRHDNPLVASKRTDRLARSRGKNRSACVREAIAQSVQRLSNDDEARRQSILIAKRSDNGDWSERLPDWADWTA